MKRYFDHTISDLDIRQMSAALDDHTMRLECSLNQAQKEPERSGNLAFSVNIFSGSAEIFLKLMESHEMECPKQPDRRTSAHALDESRKTTE